MRDLTGTMKREKSTIYAGVVECDFHELAEESTKSARDAFL
ncbi:MAG: hypothetical protein ACXWMI_05365 [Syntrophales bacterium]